MLGSSYKKRKSINEKTSDEDNRLLEGIDLDFYISGEKFIDGVGGSAKKEIEELFNELVVDLKNASLPHPKSYSYKEKSYGYGADLVVALVEFVANNEYVGALAKIGGLISFGKHIEVFLKKKRENNLFIGINAGRLIALNAVANEIEITKIQLLFEEEMDRGESGFTEKEYLYLFHVNEAAQTPQDKFNEERLYRGVIFFVHCDWHGKIKNLLKF